MEAVKRGNRRENHRAKAIAFQLQWLGVMGMAGREDEADAAYVKAQKLAQQLVDAGH